MRCCLASAARTLTLISLALLSTQSLLLVKAQSSPTTDIAAPTTTPDNAEPPTTVTPLPPTTTSTTPPPTSTTTKSVSTRPTTSPPPETTTTKSIPPTSTSTTKEDSTSTQTDTPDSTTSSSSTSTSTSTSSSTSTSTSDSTSSSITSTSSSSTPGVTLKTNTGTAYVAPTNTQAAGPNSTSYTWDVSTPSATQKAAGAASASSNSFFDNKGAVAGTFAIVGVVALGGISVVILYMKRRAARLQDEEDLTYFEKYTPSGRENGTSSPTDMSFIGGPGGREDLNAAPLEAHAAVDAYPDRATHFGLPAMNEYASPQPMDLNFSHGVDYPPNAGHGVEYPPNMGQYNPAQYGGYEGGYGATQYDATQEYYDPARRSPSSPNHPYADPSNSSRTFNAPPVQQYYPTSEVVHGEAR
ncbi:hypothetical protein C8Q80DRAFT_1218238 [Daedaleopsis nitida]|nr:hypothetical protein C8Q80DRAFT_1218238 [Daedaleopsis nitida]